MKMVFFILEHALIKKIPLTELVVKYSIKNGLDNKKSKIDIITYLKKLKSSTFSGSGIKTQLEVPFGVEIEINSKCNLRCKHCYKLGYSHKEMATQQILKYIDILYKNNVFELSLIGGEPLIHPGIEDILEHCVEIGFRTTMVTNGLRMSDRKISVFKDTGILSLLVSLEGIGRYNDVIRGGGVFEKLDPILKKISHEGIQAEVACTLTKLNIDHIEDLIKYCDELGFFLNFNLLKPFKNFQKDLLPTKKQYLNAIEKTRRLRSKFNNMGFINYGLDCLHLNKPIPIVCIGSVTFATINIDSTFVSCPHLYSLRQIPFPCNFDEHFLDAWKNGADFKRLRESPRVDCQANAFLFSGDINGIDSFGVNALTC